MQSSGDVPAQVAAVALDLGAGAIRHIEPIKHGLTNRSWLVTTDDDRVVVRISDKSALELQIDRNSEAAVLQLVARADIGPEVLRCDPEHGILVTRYLGATWNEPAAQLGDNIDRLAALLRRLHALDVPKSVRVVDLASTLIVVAGTFSDSAKIDPQSLKSRFLECLRGTINNLVVHRSTE